MIDKIIIFGVSGVGKTTICRSFVAAHKEFQYIRVGELLQNITGLSSEQMRVSTADEIWRNQALIGAALDAYIERSSSRPILVDAHAVIDNDRQLVPVPTSVVQSLRPTGLVLVEADAEEIVRRRRYDDKWRPRRSSTEILQLLAETRNVVQQYAAELMLPLEISSNNDGFDLAPMIMRLTRYRQIMDE